MSRAFLLLASCILQKKGASMFLSVALKISGLAHTSKNTARYKRFNKIMRPRPYTPHSHGTAIVMMVTPRVSALA